MAAASRGDKGYFLARYLTSPFARRSDLRPVVDARAFDRGGGTITDGRQILVRMFDPLVDTMYRDDLDDMLTYNELIAWHARAAAAGAPLAAFPLSSYNAADGAQSHTLPYEIVLVGPQREDSDPITLFNVEPATQRRSSTAAASQPTTRCERNLGSRTWRTGAPCDSGASPASAARPRSASNRQSAATSAR